MMASGMDVSCMVGATPICVCERDRKSIIWVLIILILSDSQSNEHVINIQTIESLTQNLRSVERERDAQQRQIQALQGKYSRRSKSHNCAFLLKVFFIK